MEAIELRMSRHEGPSPSPSRTYPWQSMHAWKLVLLPRSLANTQTRIPMYRDIPIYPLYPPIYPRYNCHEPQPNALPKFRVVGLTAQANTEQFLGYMPFKVIRPPKQNQLLDKCIRADTFDRRSALDGRLWQGPLQNLNTWIIK